MSSTVSPAIIHTDGPRGVFCHEGHPMMVADTYGELVAAIEAKGTTLYDLVCDTCVEHDAELAFQYTGGSIVAFTEPELPEVNLSARNICEVMAAMGLPAEEYGECDAADFLARAQLLTIADDAGRPTIVEGNVIDLGRRVGYLAEVGARLVVVAQAAMDLGVEVRWG